MIKSDKEVQEIRAVRQEQQAAQAQNRTNMEINRADAFAEEQRTMSGADPDDYEYIQRSI